MQGLSDLNLSEEDGLLKISANFVAPTLGYTVSLDAVQYVIEPADKIQDFTLSVVPPPGPYVLPALQVFALGSSLPEWAEGARINGPSLEQIASIRQLIKEGQPIGSDMYFVEAACVKGDKLIADIRYGGGCARHDFRLTWDGSLDKSNPPQALLQLSHNANGDPCKALISERLTFDLSPHFDSPAEVNFRIGSDTDERLVPRCAGA